MKLFSIVFTIFLTVAAQAESYDYQCFLTTNKDVQISFNLSSEQMVLHDQHRLVSLDPFKVVKGNAILENLGFKGGNGKMKDRLHYSVNYNRSEVVSATTHHFYVEKELTNGGKLLRNGSYGGFVSFEGQGYSYESYLCFMKN